MVSPHPTGLLRITAVIVSGKFALATLITVQQSVARVQLSLTLYNVNHSLYPWLWREQK